LFQTGDRLEQKSQLVNENISENQGVKELIFEDEIIFLIREPGKLANV